MLCGPIFRRPVFNLGFRPRFLLASALAVLIVPLWLAIFTGLWPAPAYLGFVEWHAHEMLFGYTVAVIAGFLLTAVRNWTFKKRVSSNIRTFRSSPLQTSALRG